MKEPDELLKSLGVFPKKSMGQNFLHDISVINAQILESELLVNETVLEIGPGLGFLTEELLKNCNVIAIEKDLILGRYLKKKFSKEIDSGQLQIITGDALKIDFPYFDKIVSNIPYSISSPITFKILDYEFKKAVILYQKEFANRLVAKSGKDYSRLSVNIYYKCDTRIIKEVPRTAFFPVPKVDSALVELMPVKKRFSVMDEKLFFTIVEKLFSQRRKKIKNILGNVPHKDKRVEEITPRQIAEISDFIFSRDSTNP